MENKKTEKTKIEFLNNCLLIDNSILVFSDFHLGYEDYLNKEGILLNIQLKEIIKDLNELFRFLFLNGKVIRKIIILGDLKHNFGEVNDEEWREVIKLLDYFIEKAGSKNIILIKGNHDNYLIDVAKKKELSLVNYFIYNEIVFMHGNKFYEKELGKRDHKKLILGHLHPAINLKDDYKKEKYKCFLRGKWERKEFIVIPSFGGIVYGYNLSKLRDNKKSIDKNKKRGKNKKDFLFVEDKNLLNSDVIIYNPKDKKEYNFGVLKKLV